MVLRLSRKSIDYYIAFAVFIQSLLVLLQQVMISVFGMTEDSTTIYRVLLTAIPLSIAIFLAFGRQKLLFLKVYFWSILILLLNVIVFPSNANYLWRDSIYFLLPVVIPSALCLMVLPDIEIVEKAIYRISWLVVAVVLYYVLNFFAGKFVVDGYNMGLS